jgi:hypothetical protein
MATPTPGTIPALTPYQPAALPITGQELVEICSSINATSAISGSMLITDVVGKAPSALPQVTPVSSDVVTIFQSATGLPKACQVGSLAVPAGNVAAGGTHGQIYAKNSATNFDASWFNITSFVAAGTSLGTSGTATSMVINVANAGIGSAQLGNNAVLRANLSGTLIGSAQLDASAVLRSNLTAIAVGSAQLDVGAVLRTNLTAVAVGSAQLDVAAVLRANITAFAIGSGQLDTAAVGVPQGGTNTSILTQNAVLYGNGSSTIGLAAGNATGQLLHYLGGAPTFNNFVYSLGFTRATTSIGVLSSTTQAAIQNLSASLAATSNYLFQATVFVTAGSTGGSQVSVTAPGTPSNIIYEAQSFAAGALVNEGRATANSVVLATSTAAVVPTFKIVGQVSTNASGTLTINIAQVAATTTTTVVLAGSHLQVWQTS